MSAKEVQNRIELLQDTLDLLILRTLLVGPAAVSHRELH
jgi:hypothetical protein